MTTEPDMERIRRLLLDVITAVEALGEAVLADPEPQPEGK